MEYRHLGSSGLKVSAIALGGWITLGDQIDETTAREIIQLAVARGINLFDLADSYAGGDAERVFGSILKDFKRSDLVLSSKVALPVGPGPNDQGLSRKHITESLEQSLDRLGTDYLDLYFCHREDPSTPLEETVRTMDELIRRGKILYWGTSVWRPRTLMRAHRIARKWGLHPPRVEQPPYNLIDRWVEKRVVPTVNRLGMGMTVWSPLAGGVLTGKYNDGIPAGSRGDTTPWVQKYMKPAIEESVRAFCLKAEAQSVAPGTLALAWLLKQKNVSSIITGASHPDQLEQNLAALDVELSAHQARSLARCFSK
ncbi:MAG: aldo/keto reductase family protein [Myxococcota bacterium]|nr:aldo/keto reductase family protein [Myxococcota bacterium]